MMPWLLSGLGLIVLLLAGDALVRGAVSLSLRLGIPALIVSLTIVAFGTSAPELLIAIQAVFDEVPGIAMGNVVGSNTANALLVLGVPALVATLHTSECNTRRSYFYMLAASALFVGLAHWGPFTATSGMILLAALVFFLWQAYRAANAHREQNRANEVVDAADPKMPYWRIAMYLALGLVGLPLGADLLVENASIIARLYGVTDSAIGLTLVALGTSLPELATTVMAAHRRQADVALGNVIGSNMFNLLAIIGIATLFGDIPVDPGFLRFDLWVMLGASVILVPFVFWRMDISRRWGILLSALYVAYIAAVLA